jgi:hydroxyacylglutathione hydrolase
LLFKQIKHNGDNFSYVIADSAGREAAVVDPSFNAEIVARVLKDQKLRLEYIINTHSHSDHTAGNESLRSIFNARVVAHRLSTMDKDVSVVDGDTVKVGKVIIDVIHTPGHTPDSICLLVDGKLLTGDTLFVGECGRTDLPGGDPKDMYHSLFYKLMTFDDGIEVYPGHDYGNSAHSTIGKEKKTNYTLKKRDFAEFIEFMSLP